MEYTFLHFFLSFQSFLFSQPDPFSFLFLRFLFQHDPLSHVDIFIGHILHFIQRFYPISPLKSAQEHHKQRINAPLSFPIFLPYYSFLLLISSLFFKYFLPRSILSLLIFYATFSFTLSTYFFHQLNKDLYIYTIFFSSLILSPTCFSIHRFPFVLLRPPPFSSSSNCLRFDPHYRPFFSPPAHLPSRTTMTHHCLYFFFPRPPTLDRPPTPPSSIDFSQEPYLFIRVDHTRLPSVFFPFKSAPHALFVINLTCTPSDPSPISFYSLEISFQWKFILNLYNKYGVHSKRRNK